MAPPADLDPFRAQFRDRMNAWRAALRGVPSGTVAGLSQNGAPPRGSPPSAVEQASFEFARPRARFFQPIAVGGFVAFYITTMSVVALGAGAILVFAALMGVVVAFAHVRRFSETRQAAGRVLNAAFNQIGLGRLRDASDLLDLVAARTSETWAHRLVEIQRATIAIRRGEIAAADEHLTAAIELPVTGYGRDNAHYQLEGARALRAFVRASLGQHDLARADIERVLQLPASDDAVARITLARAMILEQQGKREELRQLLADHGTLLLEHTHPRERAIVRAFQRMVRTDSSSVYRRAEARRDKTSGEEPMLADWVAKVAPGAASFVRSTRPADHAATVSPQDGVVHPTESALRANSEARRPPGAGRKYLAPVAGLIAVGGVLAAVFAFLTADNAATFGGVPTVAASPSQALLPLVLVLALAVPLAVGTARALRALARRSAERAARKTAAGPATPPTEAQLRALTRTTPSPTIAAQAFLFLADRAEHAGDFLAALDAATEGLSRLADPHDRAAADIVYPDLVSLRAFALAALGHVDQADAELATLGPVYPHYSRAVFRTRLLILVRSGDLAAAAAWIHKSEADLPLSVREELLADLTRAAHQPTLAGAGEIQRLKDELRTTPANKLWIQRAVPHLLDSFENPSEPEAHLRIHPPDEDLAREGATRAEEEAAASLLADEDLARESATLAEEEAAAAVPLARRSL